MPEAISCHSGNPVKVDIAGGIIKKVSALPAADKLSDRVFIAPGLIDIQVNGFAGVDFSSENLSTAMVGTAARELLKTGVTSFLPTLITAPHDTIIANLKVLSEAVDKDDLVKSMVPGFHLEGPYISPLDGYRGCHPEKYVRIPSWEEFSAYLECSGNRIKIVTIAPETDGALDFIRKCSGAGVVVALGHTSSGAEIINEAVANGARLATHLGNGCANMIHRHHNPIWPQLANDLLTPSVIADGHHLLPEEINVFIKVKGFDNLIITSDVIHLAGMAPGRYSFLGSEVELTTDGMLIDPAQNCLAGASFPLVTGVENILRFTACTMDNAIKLASSNPARILGLGDRGKIEEDMRADLVEFSYSDGRITILKTYIDGILLYARNP